MRFWTLWNPRGSFSRARWARLALVGALLASQGATAAVLDLEGVDAAVRWANEDGSFWESQKYVSGDFDGDGYTDVSRVFGVGGSTFIDTFLSNGTHFTSANWAVNVGGFSDDQRYLAADFNGDGQDDILRIWNHGGLASFDVLVSSGSSFTFSRWLTQSGGFDAAMQWEVGDFDGNGLPDVARIFAEANATSIEVQLSTGSNFLPQRWITSDGGHWTGVQYVTGDFTGDGLSDVVKLFPHGGQVSMDLYPSNGSGFLPFVGAARLLGAWGVNPQFESGDWDGDGAPDIAQLVGVERGLEANVFLFDGTLFEHHALFDVTSRSSRYTVGDYDGDGKTEIAGIDGRFGFTDLEVFGGPTPAWEYDAQAVRWQTGSGYFSPLQIYLAGDFNGDGAPDMARVFNDGGLTSVDVHRNTGSGFEYTRWASQQGGHSTEMHFLAGDVNGDGIDDILKVFPDAGATSVDVYLGGTTQFTYHRWLTRQGGHWQGQKFVAGDFNGDGMADLAKIWGWDGLATMDIYLSAGTHFPTFTYWAVRDGGFWTEQDYVVGDYTGDGRDDIARIFTDAGLTSVDVFTSEGTFFSQQRWITQQIRSAAGQKHVAGDFDGDGRDDLVKVGANSGSKVEMALFPSKGSYFESTHFLEEETGFVVQLKTAAADFDLDGRAEVATAYRTSTVDTHFDVYGGDFVVPADPSRITSSDDGYAYTFQEAQANLGGLGYTLSATDHLAAGQCTVVYPNTDHVGPSRDLGVLTCAYLGDLGETLLSSTPVYGGCDVANSGGECEIGIFKKSMTVDFGGAPVELQFRGPRARVCGQVSRSAVCAKTTATLWDASTLITDGNGNGGGVGVFAGFGGATRARYQDGVLSGDLALGLGPGVRIKFSVNVLSAASVGESGFDYAQEGVDEAVQLSGEVIGSVDDAVDEVSGTLGDLLPDWSPDLPDLPDWPDLPDFPDLPDLPDLPDPCFGFC